MTNSDNDLASAPGSYEPQGEMSFIGESLKILDMGFREESAEKISEFDHSENSSIHEEITPDTPSILEEITDETPSILQEISPGTPSIYEKITPETPSILQEISPGTPSIYEKIRRAGGFNN